MKKQYTDDIVNAIEAVYGDTFLSQGNKDSVIAMLLDMELNNKTCLDIGCGLGGPSLALAEQFPTLNITGIDVDADLVSRANITAQSSKAAHRIEFRAVTPEPALPFPDQSFDTIFGKESWLHIPDKRAFFKECHRVLKKGGTLITLDWMHSNAEYSDLMKTFVHADGLMFHLTTIDEYLQLLKEAQFHIVHSIDNSAQALRHTRDNVELIKQSKAELIERFGEEHYHIYLDSWSMQVKIFETGEMQTYLIHAIK